MSSAFKVWMLAASPATQERLAAAIGTSRAYLYQWSNGHREPEALTAAKIEHETRAIHEETGGFLPIVLRTEVNTACANCEFAKQCLGESVK
jgi:transcriptional regulator with XRE-family HTH domain